MVGRTVGGVDGRDDGGVRWTSPIAEIVIDLQRSRKAVRYMSNPGKKRKRWRWLVGGCIPKTCYGWSKRAPSIGVRRASGGTCWRELKMRVKSDESGDW